MLEDPNIQHLISWSASSESFVMSPSADFSKVLSYVLYLPDPDVAHMSTQAIFQAHQYLILCSSTEHVRIP